MVTQVTFTVQPDDYVAFNKLHWRRQGGRMALTIALIVTAISVVGVIGSGDLRDFIAPVVVGLFTGGGLWLAYYFFMLPGSARKVYAETAVLHDEQHWQIVENGLYVTQPNGEARIPWDHVLRWEEDAVCFVIYANRLLGYTFPKTKVEPAFVDAMRSALRANGLPERGKRRK